MRLAPWYRDPGAVVFLLAKRWNKRGQAVRAVVSAKPPLLGYFSPGPTAVSPQGFLIVAPVMIHAQALVKLACCKEHRGLKPGLKVPETSQSSGP